MKKLLVLASLLALFAQANTFSQTRLPAVEVQSLSGQRSQLRELVPPNAPGLIALSMGISQKNGEEQVAALQQTHKQLLEAHPDLAKLSIVHLNVIAGAPFFVHGLIRNGLGKSYSAPVQSNQVFVLFINKAENFASPLGLKVDKDGTWLLVDSAGFVRWTAKEGTADLVQRITTQVLELQ